MPTKTTGKDACDLLDADHKAVKKLFKDYEALATSRARSAAQKKRELAHRICLELTVHAQIEDEIFYPALREVTKETRALEEATVEHQGMRDLIAQLRGTDTPDEHFDAQVKVLGEYVDHHVKEERTQLFAKARAARKLDLMAMREDLEQRRQALLAEMGELSEMAA